MHSFEIFNSLAGISIGAISLASILSAIVIFILCYILIQVLTRILKKALSRSTKLDGALKHFIVTATHAALWVLSVIIIADSLGIPTASLVAVVSVAGLALSLSIQNILSNLFSGITLLVTRPFSTGDLIDVGANQGLVTSIGLFYTVIDTLDQKTISIPNSDVTAASIVNYSSMPTRRVDMTFCASYNDSTQAVRQAILDAAAQDARIKSDPAPFVVIGKYGESSIEYITRVWCNNADYWDVYFGMNERVRECFEKNGVEMTYNHVNVHMIS